jgi:hypothetical protein
MNVLAVILVFSIVGFLLFILFFKQDVLFRNLKRKRSGRDRRKEFVASKNRMRRSDKDRRQTKD